MIRKLKSGEYRLYSRRADPRTGHRRNLGTFKSRGAAEKHERAVQFFKHGGENPPLSGTADNCPSPSGGGGDPPRQRWGGAGGPLAERRRRLLRRPGPRPHGAVAGAG